METKKAYIIPTVITCRIEAARLISASNLKTLSANKAVENTTVQGGAGNGGDVYQREVISAPDAWEEW